MTRVFFSENNLMHYKVSFNDLSIDPLQSRNSLRTLYEID